MNVEVSQIDVPISANGTSVGTVGVTSTSGFLPGAICQLYQVSGGTLQSLTVIITDIPSSTVLNLRIAAQAAGGPIGSGPGPASGSPGFGQTLTQNAKLNYGRSDVSAFTTSNGARICQNAQIVRAEPTAMGAPLL